MPKNKVTDLITDREMTFARLVLSGTMTDRQAAEAAGLNPDTAAYTKSKPVVRDYMLEHRAAVEKQLVEQEVDALRRRDLRREQVLDRLWELATMSSEMTRGSITGQVKAVSMIVAIEGFIPDRRAASAEKNSAPPPTNAHIYHPPWFGKQQEETTDPQPDPAFAQQEDELAIPQAEPAPGSAADAPPRPGPIVNPGESTFANRFSFPETQWVPDAGFAPDTRVPFSIPKNPFARRR
jgi:hypothetical protein